MFVLVFALASLVKPRLYASPRNAFAFGPPFGIVLALACYHFEILRNLGLLSRYKLLHFSYFPSLPVVLPSKLHTDTQVDQMIYFKSKYHVNCVVLSKYNLFQICNK